MGSTRPAVHLTPERGWMNDPHGVIYRDGLYHVFYQSNPAAAEWTTGISWGHATSPDLVTWQNHPPVLAPGDGDDGIWTGCAVDGPGGTPVIFYTSVSSADPQLARIRTARPDDASLMTWHKGPVVAEAPTHDGVVAFRDPTVRRDDGRWRMFVGAGLADGRPALVSYVSDDLERWHYAGLVAAGRPHEPWTGTTWECPQLVTIGDRTVFLISAWAEGETHHVSAAVGDYTDGRLTLDHWQQLGYGPGHYAPTTFIDQEGKPCALFWIRGIVDEDRSWAGALSIPYRISLVEDRAEFMPHPAALAALRGAHWMFDRRGGPLVVPAESGEELFRLDAAGSTLTVTAGPNTVSMPLPRIGGPVHVIADAQVLEVSTGLGLVGLPLTGRPNAASIPVVHRSA